MKEENETFESLSLKLKSMQSSLNQHIENRTKIKNYRYQLKTADMLEQASWKLLAQERIFISFGNCVSKKEKMMRIHRLMLQLLHLKKMMREFKELADEMVRHQDMMQKISWQRFIVRPPHAFDKMAERYANNLSDKINVTGKEKILHTSKSSFSL